MASSGTATTSTRGVITSRTTVSSSSIMPRIISCSCASITPDSSALRSISRSSFSVMRGIEAGSKRKSLRIDEATKVKNMPTG